MNPLSRRHVLLAAAAAAVTPGLGWRAVQAASLYPDRPLALVVPYPAGGASDNSARIFAESIGKSLKHQVVVENHGGGTGIIGANKVLSAPADGYTFMHGSLNEVFLTPLLNPAARYRPEDFTLVAPVTDSNIVLLVRRDLPARTFDGFLELAQQAKGQPMSYATVGIDSMYHLMGEALGKRIGASFLHVPYKGAAPALQGVAGGEVDFAILPYQTAFSSLADQGRLRLLTSFSTDLPAAMKGVPLISASRHVPDFEYSINGGYFVRRGSPPERVAVLRQAIGEALAKPEIRERLEAEGRTVVQPVSDPAVVQQYFDGYAQRVNDLIQGVGRRPLG